MAKYLQPSPRTAKSARREAVMHDCYVWMEKTEIARKCGEELPIRPNGIDGEPLTEAQALALATEWILKNSR